MIDSKLKDKIRESEKQVLENESSSPGRFKRKYLPIAAVGFLVPLLALLVLIVGLYLFGWVNGPVRVIANTIPLPAAKVGSQTITVKALLDSFEEGGARYDMERLINEVHVNNYARQNNIGVTEDEVSAIPENEKERTRRFLLVTKVQRSLESDETLRRLGEERAVEALKRLRSSNDFEAIAREYSGHTDATIAKNSVNPIPMDEVRVPVAGMSYTGSELPPIAPSVKNLTLNEYASEPLLIGDTYFLVRRVDDSPQKQPMVRLVRISYGFNEWLVEKKQQQPAVVYLKKVIDN